MKRTRKTLMLLAAALLMLSVAWTVQATSYTPIAVPTAVAGLVYNGSTQIGVNSGDGYVLGGTITATEANTISTPYIATATLQSGYCWNAGVNLYDVREISWFISPLPITPSVNILTFNGTSQTGVGNGAGYIIQVSNGNSQTNKGYYLTPILVDSNHVYNNKSGDYTMVPWTITAAPLPTITAPDNVVYTGSAFTPDVGMVNSTTSNPLVKDTDYTLTYANNQNKGTATVTVTGKGNYTGTSDVTFGITAASLPTITAPVDVVYTGLAFEPDVGMTNVNTGSLVKGTDYTLMYANNVYKGTATVFVTGKGNYTGTDDVTFEIVAKQIAKPTATTPQTYDGTSKTGVDDGTGYMVAAAGNTATNMGTYYAAVTVNTPNYVWTGGTSAPLLLEWVINPQSIAVPIAVTGLVYNGSTQTGVLTGPGYDLADNTGTAASNAYEATATLKSSFVWVGGYHDFYPKQISWVIVAKQIDQPTAKAPQTYDGDPKTGVDTGIGYTVTAGNTGTAAATYTATVTVNTPNYVWTGGTSETLSLEWVIVAKQIAKPMANTPQTYDGTLKTGVASGTGYTLTETPTATDFGNYTASAVLADKDNTVWSTTGNSEDLFYTWIITPATLPTINVIADQTYTGSQLTPAFTFIGSPVPATTDYSVSWGPNTTVALGGSVLVEALSTGNFTDSSTKIFVISPATLPAITAPADVVYTSIAFTPDVVMNNVITGNLVKDTDYTLAYANNVNKGTATVTVTGIGNYTGVKTVIFVITSAALPDIAALPPVVFTGLPFTPNVVMVNSTTSSPLVKDTDYTLAYGPNVNVGSSPVLVTATVLADGNYTGSQTQTFNIVKAPLPAINGIADQTYTGSQLTPAVTFNTTMPVTAADYTLLYGPNVNAGTGSVTANANAGGNYTGSQTKTFNIVAADLPAIKVIADRTYTGSQLTPAVRFYTTMPVTAADYTLLYGPNVNAGTGSVTATAAAAGNYKDFTLMTFNIVPAALPPCRPSRPSPTRSTQGCPCCQT